MSFKRATLREKYKYVPFKGTYQLTSIVKIAEPSPPALVCDHEYYLDIFEKNQIEYGIDSLTIKKRCNEIIKLHKNNIVTPKNKIEEEQYNVDLSKLDILNNVYYSKGKIPPIEVIIRTYHKAGYPMSFLKKIIVNNDLYLKNKDKVKKCIDNTVNKYSSAKVTPSKRKTIYQRFKCVSSAVSIDEETSK